MRTIDSCETKKARREAGLFGLQTVTDQRLYA